jgi:hypothetical protein
MRFLLGLALILLLSACAATPPPPVNPAFAALNIRSVAIGPIAYATYQPNEPCTIFLDEDLRSTVARELRQRGYEAFAVGNSIPRSFSAGSPLPQPGHSPSDGLVPASHADGLLSIWVDEYWEHYPCGEWGANQYMTIGAVAVLYKGSPPAEVWRSKARIEEAGAYSASDLIWLTTTRLTSQLLGSWPAGPQRREPQ